VHELVIIETGHIDARFKHEFRQMYSSVQHTGLQIQDIIKN